MSQPEPDDLFRAHLLRVVADNERHLVRMAYGAYLITSAASTIGLEPAYR